MDDNNNDNYKPEKEPLIFNGINPEKSAQESLAT